MIDMVKVPKAFMNMEASCLNAIALSLELNSSQENINKAIELLRECADDIRKLAKGE